MQRISKYKVRISRLDMKCLQSLVHRKSASDDVQSERLENLQEALDSAEELEALPTTVVALGTNVLLKNLNSNEESVYTVVLPSQADISKGLISILAPLGTALMGHSVGDIVNFDAPGGSMRFRLERILSQQENSIL